MPLKNVEHFIETFVKELEEENVAIFAGAGLSVGAGYVDWKSSCNPLRKSWSWVTLPERPHRYPRLPGVRSRALVLVGAGGRAGAPSHQ